MKTLYQRLSEDNKAKLKEASKEFPTTVMLLIQYMKLNFTWSGFPIGDAMSLYGILSTKPFDLSTFIAFFNEK